MLLKRDVRTKNVESQYWVEKCSLHCIPPGGNRKLGHLSFCDLPLRRFAFQKNISQVIDCILLTSICFFLYQLSSVPLYVYMFVFCFCDFMWPSFFLYLYIFFNLCSIDHSSTALCVVAFFFCSFVHVFAACVSAFHYLQAKEKHVQNFLYPQINSFV